VHDTNSVFVNKPAYHREADQSPQRTTSKVDRSCDARRYTVKSYSWRKNK